MFVALNFVEAQVTPGLKRSPAHTSHQTNTASQAHQVKILFVITNNTILYTFTP
jgi:hypothetical protein